MATSSTALATRDWSRAALSDKTSTFGKIRTEERARGVGLTCRGASANAGMPTRRAAAREVVRVGRLWAPQRSAKTRHLEPVADGNVDGRGREKPWSPNHWATSAFTIADGGRGCGSVTLPGDSRARRRSLTPASPKSTAVRPLERSPSGRPYPRTRSSTARRKTRPLPP